MECPFHAGNEAITTCTQCETPICPLCASETNQIHLCLNCYRARVEELAGGLGSASTRLAKERQKAEAKVSRKHKKAKGEAKAAPEAKSAFELGSESPLWEKEQAPPVALQTAPAPDIYPVPAPPMRDEQAEDTLPSLPLEPSFGAPSGAPQAPFEQPLSKKELALLKKEEAKRIKAEEKEAKKSKKAKPIPEPEVIEIPEGPIDFDFEEPTSKKELARLKKEEAKRVKAEEKEAKKSKKEAPAPEPDVLAMPLPIGEVGPEAPEIPFQEPLSKKELARLKKEEAKRVKAEEKEVKKSKEEAPAPEPIPTPQQPIEGLPFIEAPQPSSQPAEPPVAVPDFLAPPPAPESAPQPAPEEPPVNLQPDIGLEERLEPMPNRDRGDERGDMGGPPEGFFD
ncbi:MAG: hypothetical protein A2W01_01010 [Candidatus Solincola sediminis]|nr:MAG: hypothetical protein A2W01_01010 [Candidatus Solincola sediminis]